MTLGMISHIHSSLPFLFIKGLIANILLSPRTEIIVPIYIFVQILTIDK